MHFNGFFFYLRVEENDYKNLFEHKSLFMTAFNKQQSFRFILFFSAFETNIQSG